MKKYLIIIQVSYIKLIRIECNQNLIITNFIYIQIKKSIFIEI
jgi:hypothetical protein